MSMRGGPPPVRIFGSAAVEALRAGKAETPSMSAWAWILLLAAGVVALLVIILGAWLGA